MRADLFILLLMAVPLLADHPLLEFREISTIKLISGHENIKIPISDVYGDMQNLLKDVGSLNCTSSECDNGKNLIVEQINKHNASLTSMFIDKEVLMRKKRSWDSFGKSLKWMGGIMDSDDRATLNRRVQILYENQKVLHEQFNEIMSKPEAMKGENADEIIEVEKNLKRVQELIGLQSLTERYERIREIVDGIWRTFYNQKIDGIFVTSDVLEKIRERPQLACGKIVNCIKNADSEVEIENSKFIINLKIPTISEQQLKLYEITSLPSDLDSYILLLKLPQKYFGYDEQNKNLIALDEKSLILCRHEDESTYCRAKEIIQNVNTDECLEKAFRDKEVESEMCGDKMELWQATGFGVAEIGNGNFWVHTKKRKDMTIFCSKAEREIKTFKSSEIFHLTFGCHAVFKADGIDLTSYVDAESSERLNTISASISKEDFTDIVESMEVSNYLKNRFMINIQSYKTKGLKQQEKQEPLIEAESSRDHQYQASTANELKTIRAQHHEALIVVSVIAISLMLFIALKSSKPYIIKFLPKQKSDDIEEQDSHESEEKKLNEIKM